MELTSYERRVLSQLKSIKSAPTHGNREAERQKVMRLKSLWHSFCRSYYSHPIVDGMSSRLEA